MGGWLNDFRHATRVLSNASWLPARWAAAVDPAVALRHK